MTDDKWPKPVDPSMPDQPALDPEEAEHDFFADEEHDGWSGIVKRRPSDPGLPPQSIRESAIGESAMRDPRDWRTG
jgi:hypothetical protein